MKGVAAIEGARLEPGGSCAVGTAPISAPLRVRRLVLEATAGRPELRYYQRGIPSLCAPAGGSRRRGQRASQLWAIRCLIDRQKRPPAIVVVSSLTIGAREYLLAPVPISVFGPTALTGFELGMLLPGAKAHLDLRSCEDVRPVIVAGAILGDPQRGARA